MPRSTQCIHLPCEGTHDSICFGKQLELFPSSEKRQKPQISLTPGVSIKEQNHYRVTLAGEVLADKLTLDQALKLVKRGEA